MTPAPEMVGLSNYEAVRSSQKLSNRLVAAISDVEHNIEKGPVTGLTFLVEPEGYIHPLIRFGDKDWFVLGGAGLQKTYPVPYDGGINQVIVDWGGEAGMKRYDSFSGQIPLVKKSETDENKLGIFPIAKNEGTTPKGSFYIDPITSESKKTLRDMVDGIFEKSVLNAPGQRTELVQAFEKGLENAGLPKVEAGKEPSSPQ